MAEVVVDDHRYTWRSPLELGYPARVVRISSGNDVGEVPFYQLMTISNGQLGGPMYAAESGTTPVAEEPMK